jgi:hypothetical protein
MQIKYFLNLLFSESFYYNVLTIFHMVSGFGIHYIFLKRGYNSLVRVILTSLGFYLGPYIFLSLFIIKKGKK